MSVYCTIFNVDAYEDGPDQFNPNPQPRGDHWVDVATNGFASGWLRLAVGDCSGDACVEISPTQVIALAEVMQRAATAARKALAPPEPDPGTGPKET